MNQERKELINLIMNLADKEIEFIYELLINQDEVYEALKNWFRYRDTIDLLERILDKDEYQELKNDLREEK